MILPVYIFLNQLISFIWTAHNFHTNHKYKTICQWSGTAPFCKGNCDSDELRNDLMDYDEEKYYMYRTKEKEVSKSGDGSTCLTGFKKLCCVEVLKFPEEFWLKRKGKELNRRSQISNRIAIDYENDAA